MNTRRTTSPTLPTVEASCALSALSRRALDIPSAAARRLQYPNVPCLDMGSPAKPNYLPPELCRILPGQRRLKLDPRQARRARVQTSCPQVWPCRL